MLVHETHQRHETPRIHFVSFVCFVDSILTNLPFSAFRRGLSLSPVRNPACSDG